MLLLYHIFFWLFLYIYFLILIRRLGYKVDLEDRRGKDEQRVDEGLHLCIYKVQQTPSSNTVTHFFSLLTQEIPVICVITNYLISIYYNFKLVKAYKVFLDYQSITST